MRKQPNGTARQEVAGVIGEGQAGSCHASVEILKGQKPRRIDDAETGRRHKSVPGCRGRKTRQVARHRARAERETLVSEAPHYHSAQGGKLTRSRVRLLMPEVNHRAKNMLSLVHGGRLTSIFGTPACGGTQARLALRRPLEHFPLGFYQE